MYKELKEVREIVMLSIPHLEYLDDCCMDELPALTDAKKAITILDNLLTEPDDAMIMRVAKVLYELDPATYYRTEEEAIKEAKAVIKVMGKSE